MENSPEIKQVVDNRFYYVGFWIRFWAYLVDIILIGSFSSLLTVLIDSPIKLFGFITIDWMVSGVIYYGYFVLLTLFFQQTLGKMIFGIKVVSIHKSNLSWFTIFFREGIGRYISKGIFLLGFVFVGFTNKKQALHDLIADTLVIYEGADK